MDLRKGQFIVNHMRGMKIPDKEIGRRLFAMRNEEFEEIERAYRMYVISKIHDPKEWDDVFKRLDKDPLERLRKKKGKKQ